MQRASWANPTTVFESVLYMVQQHPLVAQPESVRRLRKPTVKDPRLIVGVLLVAVSVWLGVWAVNDAQGLAIAYVARTPILAGQPVTQDNLEAIEVNLTSAGDQYLTAPISSSETMYATKSVEVGELVPSAVLQSAADYTTRVLPVSTNAQLPESAGVGTTVDLWATPGKSAAPEAQPVLVAESLIVNELPASSSAFSASRGQTVHVVVPEDLVSAVLAATAGDSALSLLMRPQDAP